MILKLEAGKLKTEIELPGSKSHANRYLILAARRGLGTRVHALPSSDDVTLLLEGLEKIGLELEGTDPVVFKNSFPDCEKDEDLIFIDVGEGGTTARFLLALLCRGKRQYLLQTRGRLKERPWEELIHALTSAGAKIEWRGTNLLVQGPVDLKKLPRKISASRSTQFASALQLAYAADGLTFEPYDLTSSTPYWLMTTQALKDVQTGVLTVPADWSSASYPMALASLQSDSVLLRGLRPDEQADRALFDFLLSRGAVQVTAQGIIVSKLNEPAALKMNVTQCPDLTPTLAFLASHLEGESILTGLSVLRHKESDRLQAICDLLSQCGVSYQYDERLDQLTIWGGVKSRHWDLKVPADHRLVMAGSLFLKLHKGGTISHPEAVRKSFPDFFKIFD